MIHRAFLLFLNETFTHRSHRLMIEGIWKLEKSHMEDKLMMNVYMQTLITSFIRAGTRSREEVHFSPFKRV